MASLSLLTFCHQAMAKVMSFIFWLSSFSELSDPNHHIKATRTGLDGLGASMLSKSSFGGATLLRICRCCILRVFVCFAFGLFAEGAGPTLAGGFPMGIMESGIGQPSRLNSPNRHVCLGTTLGSWDSHSPEVLIHRSHDPIGQKETGVSTRAIAEFSQRLSGLTLAQKNCDPWFSFIHSIRWISVDGRNPAPPKKPWNVDSPVNTNQPWFPMFPSSAKWISSIHNSTALDWKSCTPEPTPGQALGICD